MRELRNPAVDMKLLGILLIVLIALAFAGIGYHLVTGTTVRDALRRVIGKILCGLFGHRRRRDTVRKVGNTYLGRCRVCGIKMTREGREGEWQVLDLVAPAAGPVVELPSD